MATATNSASRKALADINYNTIVAGDHGTSSEDELSDNSGFQADDARRAIGVSIGREQTRLNSPQTPAVERAAAIDQTGGFFDNILDGAASDVGEPSGQHGLEGYGQDPGVEPNDVDIHRASEDRSNPSQKRSWKQEEVPAERSTRTKSVLRDGFSFGRRRASSGPDSDPQTNQKSFLSSLSAVPRSIQANSPFSSTRDVLESDRKLASDRETLQQGTLQAMPNARPEQAYSPERTGNISIVSAPRSTEPDKSSLSTEAEEAGTMVGDLPRTLPLHHIRLRPGPPLRRSTSDNSLMTTRSVASLGDDSRFDNIHEQVNSRFKAIKDSFQDASIKLPSMPSMPSFNVTNFTPEFLTRDRSSSVSTRQSNHGSDTGVSRRMKPEGRPMDPMTRQPYASAKAAISDGPLDKSHADHPCFNEALSKLSGDIVVLGGYRGSILRSAEPPHRQVWVPIKVGLNLRKVDLEVGTREGDDERATEKIIPDGMLTHIGPVDISKRLFKRLRTCENARAGRLRVHDYGYDWRLHPLHLSKLLIRFLEGLPCNRPGLASRERGATVIAHSLGGLITRHAVNQRPELFRGVVYAGVPDTCVNILGPLRNGDEVLLSSRVLTAQVNFTIRTSFALLPLNGRCFIDKHTREEYPVDFFNPQTWIEYRLSPCIARPLPPINAPAKPTGISGYVSSVANALPAISLPGRRESAARSKNLADPTSAVATGGVEIPGLSDSVNKHSQDAIAHGNIDDDKDSNLEAPSVKTAVTMPREEALEYLTRTLKTVKQFKEELAFSPSHQAYNLYPPVSVMYGKSTPTVYGAKVEGREGIKHADAYDQLAFASGDGVVLARAAMAPHGYQTASGGVVSSERGHVTLLGDLEAVGRCLNAVIRARGSGVGLGGQK